jgi:ribosome-associated translation inhibitor RaiA
MMQIQVNTDGNIQGRDGLTTWVEDEIRSVLAHFEAEVTRVEVHLNDENAAKAGGGDKRCLMEARPTGLQPVAVSHHAATVHEAVTSAAKKLKTALASTLGRRSDHKGGASVRKPGDM